ncbi:RNA polymerase sigma factor [Metabacillus schmidteae]|uniref:RNA polymerase sigma factor n=1 Tax=Metabacillus schmidteae TaxID=2730405 RepID=UPI001F20E797|nr:sigma-70 family RNA polymerase sigma factor [Metabacillus schmidteae]
MRQSGNLENIISELYGLYYQDVYRFLICFTGNQNDAEDLTQEVFMRVLKSYHNYHHQGSIKTWIISIAKYAAIDQLRKKKFSSIFKDTFFKGIPSNQKSPYETIELQEDIKLLYEAILKLKPNYRSVIILRAINEYTVKETAEILGCKESKVKVDFHRAINMLRKKLHIAPEEVFNNAN